MYVSRRLSSSTRISRPFSRWICCARCGIRSNMPAPSFGSEKTIAQGIIYGMRRLLSMAAICLVLSLLPMQAQVRRTAPLVTSSGRAGFGSHSGFGHGRIFHGGVAFGHKPRFRVSFGSGFHHHRAFGFHRRKFFPRAFFVPVPIYYGFSYPAAIPAVPQTDVNSEHELAREVERLRDEVERLREERALHDTDRSALIIERQGDQYVKQRGSPPAMPATVLVFRDGRRVDVRNYAIVGQTLWAFSERQARKILLSELDLDATIRVNEERGLRFFVP